MCENPITRFRRDFRPDKELTQKELADMTGIPAPMLSQWERDIRHPSLQKAFELEELTKGGIPARSWVGRLLRRAG